MAANLNDLNKMVVAPSDGNLNDGNKLYFGGLGTNTLNTVTLTFLKTQFGVTSDVLNTAWAQYFAANTGFLGNLQDKQKEFWKQGGFP